MAAGDVCEVTDALLLFNEPLTGARFRLLLDRLEGTEAARRLRALPESAARAEREARRAAVTWEAGVAAGCGGYAEEGERRAVAAYAALAERQAETASWMAARAPNEHVRLGYERAARGFAEVARELRALAGSMRAPPPLQGCAQEEGEEGDVRGRLDRVLDALDAQGTPLARLRLSPTAYRHLRDQGAFPDGATRYRGLPVLLDLGWPTSSFAVETAEAQLLEDMLRNRGRPADA